MELTRRYFLKTSGALVAYSGLSSLDSLAERLAVADKRAVARGKTPVVIFLLGGMDGLNFITPFKEREYYRLRKALALPPPGAENGLLDLDGFFGLNPQAAALHPLFQSGQAVALHAVGYANNTRSHFEEQDVWETGVIGNTVNSDGWLNRHLLTSEGRGPLRAVSVGDSLPRILRGEAPAYALRGITDLQFPGKSAQERNAMAAALEHAYCTSPDQHHGAAMDMLERTASTTFDGIRQIREISEQPYQPRAEYPEHALARKLREVARLIKSDVGLEVAEVDYGGWDTHNKQGGLDGGYGKLVRGLGDSLAAFTRDLGDRMNDVLVLTLSDFGRTAAENGNQGTDHGWANCMLALGGPVRAATGGKPRRVLTDWPGLAPEQLHQKRDLKHTTDFRDVLGEVVAKHLGNDNIRKILGSHEFRPVGLI